MLKHLCLILLIFFITNRSVCQTKFSQFYSSPLLFNPANTGRFNKNYRIGGAFRSEINTQKQLYTQSTIFADFKLFTSKIADKDCFAIGFLGLAEQNLSEGIKNNYLSLSMA